MKYSLLVNNSKHCNGVTPYCYNQETENKHHQTGKALHKNEMN